VPNADEIVECSPLGERVRSPVSACNGYIDRSHQTIRETEDVAPLRGHGGQETVAPSTKKKGGSHSTAAPTGFRFLSSDF
jgi:hypothetical protein